MRCFIIGRRRCEGTENFTLKNEIVLFKNGVYYYWIAILQKRVNYENENWGFWKIA